MEEWGEGGREKRGVWLEKGTVCIGGFTCRYLKEKLQPKFVFKSYVCTAHLPQIKDRSSEYFKEGNIRTSGSYMYEEFMPTDGIDIKVYAVGLDYAHAEARKSAVRGVGREGRAQNCLLELVGVTSVCFPLVPFTPGPGWSCGER